MFLVFFSCHYSARLFFFSLFVCAVVFATEGVPALIGVRHYAESVCVCEGDGVNKASHDLDFVLVSESSQMASLCLVLDRRSRI